MDLILRPHHKNLYPRQGILVRGQELSGWVEQIQQMGLSIPDVRVYPLPGDRANTLWGCLLVGVKDSAAVNLTTAAIAKNSYCHCAHGRLFLPEYCQLYPEIGATELGKLLGDKPHLYHPEIGWVELPGPIVWQERMIMPAMADRRIREPQPGIIPPDKVRSFVVQAMPPEEALEEMEETLLPGNRKANRQPLSVIEKFKLWLLQALFPKEKKGNARGGDGKGQGERKWWRGLTERLSSVLNDKLAKKLLNTLEDLEARNNREAGKLLDLFKDDPKEALKYAIPLNSEGTTRGGGQAAYKLSRLWQSLSVSGRHWGPMGGAVSFDQDYTDKLRQQYLSSAKEFIHQQQFREAAFIYLRLLKDYPMAAKTLEEGGLYAEAAAVHLEYTMDKLKAAQCYEKGMMLLKAIDLYKELGKDEEAGDLYLRLNKRQEAHYHFKKIINQYRASSQYLKAALICREKMNEVGRSQVLLLEGWEKNSDAVNCLNYYFSHLQDEKELEQEIRRLYHDEGKKLKYLEVLKLQYGRHDAMEEMIRDIAYEIVADNVADSPRIVSELQHFNKNDKNFTKDVLKYQQGRKGVNLGPLILLFCFLCAFHCGLQAQSGVQRLDENILERLAAGRTAGQTGFWRFISNANTPVDIAIPVVVLADGLIENDSRTKRNGLYIASSTATTYLLNLLIKQLVKRPRPFLTDVHLTPVYRPGEYSFPSGHASSSFSAVTALSRAYPRWYVIAPSLLWASAVGYSRLYLGVHYPTDVAAGAVLGASTAFAMNFLRP